MKSKATTKTVPIDSDRLKQTIRDHNYMIHELSEELGYDIHI
mgnify:CR=1 FL=1|nr:MAG TPA: Protein of unknown function (DUF1359) [Bacteriophage sp.]